MPQSLAHGNRRWWLLVGTALAMGGCAGGKAVTRVAADTTMDLSGRWNDTDSRLVSEAMIKECLNEPWLRRWQQAHPNKPPDVVVGTVRNKSAEHINVETFVKDLQRALINDGRVNFVASGAEREEVRQERMDQAVHAEESTAKGPGHEFGADYMLTGTINSIIDEEGGEKVVFYQINLTLTDMSSNRQVWIGEKKIKKFIERSAVKF